MKLNIAVLAGDGIGPEIIDQALKVTQAVCNKFGHELTFEHALTGACAIDAVGDPYLVPLAILNTTTTRKQPCALNKDCSACAKNSGSTPTFVQSLPSLP